MLTVDTAANPEPAAAGWEERRVTEVVTTLACILTPLPAGAAAYVRAGGWVSKVIKSVTKYKVVPTTVVGVAGPYVAYRVIEYVVDEVYWRACEYVYREVVRIVLVYVEDWLDLFPRIPDDSYEDAPCYNYDCGSGEVL